MNCASKLVIAPVQWQMKSSPSRCGYSSSIVSPLLTLLPCGGPLSQIHPYEDFTCLPKLDEVDNVLGKAYGERYQCQNLRPREGCQIREGWENVEMERPRDRGVDPFHEIKGDEEHFVAGAHEK